MICQWEFEGWGPNEGCAEFMDEPEIMPCGRPAIGLVQITDTMFGETEEVWLCERCTRFMENQMGISMLLIKKEVSS